MPGRGASWPTSVALAAALALCTALVGSIGAAVALTTESDGTTLAPDEAGSVTAKCAKRRAAISGGFNNPGFDWLSPADTAIWTFASRRGGGRKVMATGQNDGEATGELLAYAYCGRNDRGLTTKSSSTPLEFGELASATARCSRGSRVVWGGFEMAPESSFPLLPLGSRRNGRREWTASATTYDVDPSTLTVFAYCQRDGRRLASAASSTTLGNDEAGSATAKCRRGTEAVSGGFFAPGGFSTGGGSEIYFYESRRVGMRGWRASGLNQGDESPLRAYAYCQER